jgi:hypothetical protein
MIQEEQTKYKKLQTRLKVLLLKLGEPWQHDLIQLWMVVCCHQNLDVSQWVVTFVIKPVVMPCISWGYKAFLFNGESHGSCDDLAFVNSSSIPPLCRL